jgi:hypothetical protein
MDTRARELIRQGDDLFGRKTGLLGLWQTIAENTYVERADFTSNRTDGAEFADHLFGSYPLLARRELGNSFSTIMRPSQVPWFNAHVEDDDLDQGQKERAYLEYLTKTMRRAMYDAPARFVKATKEADHDVAAFGQAVIEATLSPDRTALLYRCHHLRDNAWSENAKGEIDANHRKWEPTARQLKEMFPGKVSREVNQLYEKSPDNKVACRHIVVPERLYRPESKNGRKPLPFTCLYVEVETETVLEETQEPWFRYVIPRWATISGSQYGVSPATVITLPDSRTFQVVIRTLREAGEMHVNPPMVSVVEALRGDVALYPGGLTTVDIEFEGKLEDALRPVDRNAGAMPIGFEIASALREDIRLGFFLDKITLPAVDPGKYTAYEFQKRIEQMAREGAPIFDPIEDDYNAPLCDLTFNILTRAGAFGDPRMAPETLRGADLKFKFRSPFRDAEDQAKAGLFIDGLTRIVMPAAQVDQAQLANVNMTKAVRASLNGIGWPAEWLNPEEAVAGQKAQQAEQAKMATGVQAVDAAGQAGKSAADAMAAIKQASAAA